jgi:hypothetical protein
MRVASTMLALVLLAGGVRADDAPAQPDAADAADASDASDGAATADGSTDAPLVPPPLSVDAKLDGTTAQVTARWSIQFTGPGWVESNPTLELPVGGVATAATATIRGHSHRMPLRPSITSHTEFEELIAAGAHAARGWAVGLHDIGDNPTQLGVDIAGPTSETITLSVDISLPTCFYRDQRILYLPQTWEPVLAAKLRRFAGPADETNGCPHDSNPVVQIALPTAELASRPLGERRIDGVAMRLPLSSKDLTRVELSLASEISSVPADLHTVFVIDTSRSITPHDADAERAVMMSYARQAATTHVQAVAYARTATTLLPAWTTASQGATRILRALDNLPARNGSNADVALAEAGRLLAQVEGSRRVVLFTDDRLADRIVKLPLVELHRLVPEGTVIHVVVVTEGTGETSLVRYDDAILGGLATATDGLAVTVDMDDKLPIDAKMLVRPISLDQVEIVAQGWEPFESSKDSCTGSLLEGSSCVWLGEGSRISGPITIEGLLWGRRFTRVLRPDPQQARTFARILAADDTITDEPTRHEIARISEAVTSAWSLYAQWGASGGYDNYGMGRLFGFGTISTSSIDDVVGVGTAGPGTGPKVDLRLQLEPIVEACHASQFRVEIELETTFEEIVDVDVKLYSLQPERSAGMRDCIIEGVWNLRLAFPAAEQHGRYVVAI